MIAAVLTTLMSLLPENKMLDKRTKLNCLRKHQNGSLQRVSKTFTGALHACIADANAAI